MSKQKKNRKNKLVAFKEREKQKKRQLEKLQQLFQKQVIDHQVSARREFLIENIMRNRPEFTKDVSGVLSVNTEAVEEREGVLVWKSDNTPVMYALVPETEYGAFSTERVNEILSTIQEKIQTRLMEQAAKAYEEALANGTLDSAFPRKTTAKKGRKKKEEVQEIEAVEVKSSEENESNN